MTELLKDQYKPGAASLFATAARKPITIWAHCPVCCVRTEQVFEREDARCEYYRCASCGQMHSFMIR